MKKKVLSLLVVVALAATAIIGGTLAYFTDTDQNTNEFAVGNVKIDLYEDVMQTDGAGRIYMDQENLGKGNKTNPEVKYDNIQPGHVMEKIAHVENTGKNDAYVALVIKQENNLNFNQNIDDYYESNNAHTRDEAWWKAQGIELVAGSEYNNATVMQKITDDVFPGWNLLYDKTQVASPNAQVRYTIDALPTSDDAGVKVLGVGYANYSHNTEEGGYYYNYSGKYFTNGTYINEGEVTGEPNFVTMRQDGSGLHDRMWIIYLQLAPGAVFDIDLTTVCPTYFDENGAAAFEGMALDIKAFAIQCAGFTSDSDGQKAAFAEVLKADDCFTY